MRLLDWNIRKINATSSRSLRSVLDAIDEGDPESAAEMRMQIVSLILAGSDTTRAALAIQTGLLLAHRAQWEAVCRDEALIPGAVAEALRFEPAVGSFPRFTLWERAEVRVCISSAV